MDEILLAPKQGLLSGSALGHEPAQGGAKRTDHSRAAAQATLGRLRRQYTRVFHRAATARADRPILTPLAFLAISCLVGVFSVVTSIYTPAYAVKVDQVQLGIVRSPEVFENVVDRVEARVSAILGYDYSFSPDIEYESALLRKDTLTSIAGFENYLLDQVGEVTKGFVLRVDGQVIGAGESREELLAMLSAISAPYLTEHTVKTEFVNSVSISPEYVAYSIMQDISQMTGTLTANTVGQTTYEVKKGDTFMAVANANGMTMAEMEVLNPDVNVNKLQVGQLLTIKKSVPFLSVRTLETLTYNESIACPVEEVADSTMYQGESKVLDPGVPGQALVTAELVFVNGYEEERNILSSTTLSEPTTKVVAVGTKVRPSWYPNGYFVWPCSGRITSSFGYRSIFGSYSYHSGMDIANSYGSTIRAADGGTVTFSGYKGSYGYLVIIDHGNGFQTYYGHCSSLYVSVGDKVYQGQSIAAMGSTGRATGNHCHFEVKVNGTSVNPAAYLP